MRLRPPAHDRPCDAQPRPGLRISAWPGPLQLPVSRQAVVKHLAVLEAAGLAEGSREGRRVVHRLTPGEFAAAARRMGDVGAAWDRRLAGLAQASTGAQ